MKRVHIKSDIVDGVEINIVDSVEMNVSDETDKDGSVVCFDEIDVFGGYISNDDGTFTPPVIQYSDATAEEIKAEAERRITKFYPIPKQINMISRATELQDIIINGGSFNPAEQYEHDALIGVKSWIGLVRTASNQIELSPPKSNELKTDKRWPSDPAY